MSIAAHHRLSQMGVEVKQPHKRDEKGKGAKQDEREIKKYIKRARVKTPKQLEENRQAAERLARECEFRRRKSICDGLNFLQDFLDCHFEEHLDQIRITCDLTLEQIKMIGNEEDKKWGVRQCRRLFNAPVLSDQIGYLLWCELRQGDTLDHRHEKHANRESETETKTETEAEGWLIPIEEAPEPRESDIERHRNGSVDTEVSESEPSSPTCRVQRRQTGIPHDNYGWNPAYFTPSGMGNLGAVTAPGSPAPEPDEAHPRERARSAPDRLHMPRKKVDYLIADIRKRTAVGAGYLAASLASGYCL
ncbi:hypothetical protein F4775DRAFT_421377 [Biscogniauxia sp. FL1348]|nr:hypothetical protein F4775DRAFT_421377 [Biscogniauxia sp. FL1348]